MNEILKRLIEAYEGEFDAIIDYTAYWYNGNSPVFEDIIDEECDHARLLAARIIELGGLVPCYWPKGKDEPSRDPMVNYRDAFDDEIKDIKSYGQLALMTKSTDARTYAIIQGILEDEKRHASIFQGYLK